MLGAASLAATPSVDRRFDDDGSHILERLEGSPLVDQGLVNIIVLEPIARRFGARWGVKRESVYENVGRVLARSVGEEGYFGRVSDTDFVVVQPDLGKFSAQARCQRAFREIWRHFLGEEPEPGMIVHRVTDLSSRGITAEPINPAEAAAGEARENAERKTYEHRSFSPNRAVLSPSNWVPFVASDGRKVNVVCTLEPVFNLKSHARIGFRLKREVMDIGRNAPLTVADIDNLGRSDHLRIDMATMAHGIARLESDHHDRPELSLIVPLSYVSLAHQVSRQAIGEALSLVRESVLAGVICEIYDGEDVPHAALFEAIALIRPWSLLVSAHLRHLPERSLKEVGLNTVSISCPLNIAGDAEFIGWLKPWVRTCHHLTRSLMVYRCGTSRRLAIAAVLGVTHGSLGPADGPSEVEPH